MRRARDATFVAGQAHRDRLLAPIMIPAASAAGMKVKNGSLSRQRPHNAAGQLQGRWRRLRPDSCGDAAGKLFGQVAAEQLLDEIERVEKRAVFDDETIAQCEEFGDRQLHDAFVVALGQMRLDDRCRAIVLHDDGLQLVGASRVALLLNMDRLRDPVLALFQAMMREDFDRCVGDGCQRVMAASLETSDVAGVKRFKKSQDAFFCLFGGHCVSPIGAVPRGEPAVDQVERVMRFIEGLKICFQL